MGSPVSRKLFVILNNEDFSPVIFLKVRLAGQADPCALRLTSYGEQVTWDGQTWDAAAVRPSQAEEKLATTSGEIPAVTVTVGNVDRQMAGILGRAELEGADARLWLTDRRLLANARDARVITRGEVRDVALSDGVLTFQVVGVLGKLEQLNFPRRCYQAKCNYVFGTVPHCGAPLNASPNTIRPASGAGPGSTRDYLVLPAEVLTEAGNPSDPNEFWATGYVVMENGPAGLQSRQIQRIEQYGGQWRAYLRLGFMNAPNAGDPFIIRRNCRRTKDDCQTFLGNVLQYGGFEEVPPIRFNPHTKRYEQLDP